MSNNDTLTEVWLGHYRLATLAAMIADMCESLSATRELASEGSEAWDVVSAAEQIADEAEGVNVTLAQIAAMVAYCDRSYGEEATIEALADFGADPAVIAEAQEAMKAKV